MTLDDVRNALKLRLRQSGNIQTANQLIKDPQDYYSIINDCLITLAQLTRKPEVFFVLQGGWPVQNPPVREIKLSPNIIQIFRVYINGQRIEPVSLNDLDGEQIKAWDATWTVYAGDTINPLQKAGDLPVAFSNTNSDQVRYYLREQDRLILGLNVPQSTAVPVVIHGVSLERFNSGKNIVPYGLKWKNWLVKECYKEIMLIIGSDDRLELMDKLTEKERRQANIDIHLAQSDRGIKLQPLPYKIKWRQDNIYPATHRGSRGRPYGWGP